MVVPVGVALGSNLGDRAAEIEAGFLFLASLAADGQVRRSDVLETAPVDCPPGSAPFLNAVAEIEVDPAAWTPTALQERLKHFELLRGRPREHARHAPRPLDLDLLYFGDRVIASPELTLPHPRLAQRRFVLDPLAQLRPELVLPGQTRSVAELLTAGAGARSRLALGMDYRSHPQEIEKLAYQLWEKEGCLPGRALANWLKAERLLSDEEFLENEIEVEEEEGGLVLPPKPSPPDPESRD